MPDHARPLNPRGRSAAAAMRAAMAGLGLTPSLVLVSSSRRTLQTLEMLQPWATAPRTKPMDGLYLASAAELLEVLHTVPADTPSVLLIGHNPGVHDLSLHLVGEIGQRDPAAHAQALLEGYPTGALAVLSITTSWADLGAGSGQLDHFFGPRDLPEPMI
jgi:phosphohistidine phosphatase